MSYIIGYGIAAALLGFIWHRHGNRWRTVARAYGRAGEAPRSAKHCQMVIVKTHRLLFSRYQTASIAVGETDLTLSLFIPFSIFHPPIFIPYDHIETRPTTWIGSRAVAIKVRDVPDIEIVMWDVVFRWVEKNAGNNWPANAEVAA